MLNNPEIKVDIEAGVAGFESGLDRAARKTEEFKRVAGDTSGLREMERASAAADLALVALGGALALGTTAVVAGSAAWVAYQGVQLAAAVHMSDTADELGKMSQRIGIQTQTLSELRYAFEMNDSSAGQMEATMKRLASRMQDAVRGNGQAALAFKSVGVEVTAANGALKPLEEILGTLADRISGYRDGAAKTALVQDLLGQGAEKLIPLLNQGADGLRANAEEARKFGVIYTDEAAKAAGDFHDNLKKLTFAAEGARNKLGGPFVAALADATEWMMKAYEKGGMLYGVLAGIGMLELKIAGVEINPLKRAETDANEIFNRLLQLRAGLKAAEQENDGLGGFLGNFINKKRVEGFKADIAEAERELKRAISQRDKLLAEADRRTPEKPTTDAPLLPDTPRKVADHEPARLKAEFAERLKLIKESTALEQQLLKTAQAEGLISEEEYWASMNAAAKAGLVERARALSEQLRQTKDPAERERILGEIRVLGVEAAKGAAQYQESVSKITAARHKLMNDGLAGENKRVDAIVDQNKALKEQLETIGLSAEQLGEYKAAKQEAAAAAELLAAKNLEEAASTMEGSEATAEAREYYLQLAAARREAGQALQEQAQLIREVGGKQLGADLAKEISTDLSRSLTDAIWRGFEGGKDAGKNFVDSLINLTKTMALRIVVQPVMQGMVGGVMNLLGMSGSSPALAGQGSGAGGFGDLLSMGNNAYNYFTGSNNSIWGNLSNGFSSLFGGGAGSGISLGAGMAGVGAGLSFAGAGIGGAAAAGGGMAAIGGLGGGISGGLGVAGSSIGAGALGSGISAAGGGVAAGGAAAGGIMSTIGAAIPWIGAIIALAAAFSKKRGGPKFEGSQGFDLSTGAAFDDSVLPGGKGYTADVADAQIEALMSPTIGTINQIVTRLGGTLGDAQARFSFARDPRGDAPTRVGGDLFIGGQQVYASNHDYGRSDEDFQAGTVTELKRLTLAAVGAAQGLSPIFGAIIAGIGDIASASSEQIDAAIAHINDAATVLDYSKLDPFAAATEAAEAASRTLMETWSKQGEAISALTSTFDGSAAATATLASMTQTRYQAEIQLAQQIASVRSGFHDSAAASVQNFQTSFMDKSELNAWLDNDIAQMMDRLKKATDPAEIQRLSAALLADTNRAWGLLTPEQQRAQSGKYVDLTLGTDTDGDGRREGGYQNLVDERLAAAEQRMRDERAATARAITDAMDRAAEALEAAAAAMARANSGAANDLSAAALALAAAGSPNNWNELGGGE